MKLRVIFYKELIDGLRDQRTMLLAMGFVLFGPAMLAIGINLAAKLGRESTQTPFALCGAGTAPDLISHLQATGLKLAKSSDICLDIPESYAARLAAGKTVRLAVRADLAGGNPTVDKLAREIDVFASTLATQRLLARGVAPQVAKPIRVTMQNTNRVSPAATLIGNALILYILYAPFLLILAMAADTTAGERERHSLQPLLTHAVSPLQIVAGKFAALGSVNLVGAGVCIALSLLLIGHSAAADLGLRVATDLATGLNMWLRLAPLCLLVAATQLTLGLFTKSTKEAQQSLTLLSMVPLFVGIFVMFRPALQIGAWPLAWEAKALAAPLVGSTATLTPFPLIATLELGIAAILLLTGARRLHGESVLA